MRQIHRKRQTHTRDNYSKFSFGSNSSQVVKKEDCEQAMGNCEIECTWCKERGDSGGRSEGKYCSFLCNAEHKWARTYPDDLSMYGMLSSQDCWHCKCEPEDATGTQLTKKYCNRDCFHADSLEDCIFNFVLSIVWAHIKAGNIDDKIEKLKQQFENEKGAKRREKLNVEVFDKVQQETEEEHAQNIEFIEKTMKELLGDGPKTIWRLNQWRRRNFGEVDAFLKSVAKGVSR